jgi:Icc-related predicted phosphoesterase
VKQQQLGPGRLLVVGDVHGCLDELQQLLQTVDYKQGSDNLVFVGDLVNKGPKSAEVGVVSVCRNRLALVLLWLHAVRRSHHLVQQPAPCTLFNGCKTSSYALYHVRAEHLYVPVVESNRPWPHILQVVLTVRRLCSNPQPNLTLTSN